MNDACTKTGLTYMRVTSSTFIAWSNVNVLMTRHETNHVPERTTCFRRKDTPYVAGQNEPRMNKTVRTSLWM